MIERETTERPYREDQPAKTCRMNELFSLSISLIAEFHSPLTHSPFIARINPNFSLCMRETDRDICG